LGVCKFINFDSGTGFARPLLQLAEALRVDLQWIRDHTRLGENATRWDERGRPEPLLLRGDDIDAARKWMATRNAAAPEITEVQRAFVKASEEAESARLDKEREQLKATVRQQRRIAWLLGGVAVLMGGSVLGLIASLFGDRTPMSPNLACYGKTGASRSVDRRQGLEPLPSDPIYLVGRD
jgi:hypothetical protein